MKIKVFLLTDSYADFFPDFVLLDIFLARTFSTKGIVRELLSSVLVNYHTGRLHKHIQHFTKFLKLLQSNPFYTVVSCD